jgi:hypothetical protein
VDYDPNAPLTKEFFATVQNKLHWAITGQTAAEFLYHRADATKLCMGTDKGKVSALEARLKAEAEYEVYRQRQDADYVSDFDREIKRLEGRKEDEKQ